MNDIKILWFRQDLRISDNPALSEASKTGSIMPIYIHDTKNSDVYINGSASKCWLHYSLLSLDSSLENKLSVYVGDPIQIISMLIDEYHVGQVYWNRCYEKWRIDRDKNIKEKLKNKDIEVNTFNGSLLWEPWETVKNDGTPYKVFTPYYRKGCLQANPPRKPLPIPKQLNLITDDKHSITIQGLDLLPKIPWDKKIINHWKIGETAAQEKLNNFIDKGLKGYKDGRNFPAKNNVSHLSPHIHFGEVSPNQVWYKAKEDNDCDANDRDHFLSELGWREFSHSLLYNFPHLPDKNLQSKFDLFPWQSDKKKLEAWKHGKTGYPIVDAGMRELWRTGYIHNRVRMVVGSFLVKNLLIDWRHGERWFWDCLVDADLANNSASWQWVAGCGADAAPYFRIFNPITQGNKFDTAGIYTRKYVPELAKLPDRYLFSPWEAPEDVLSAAEIELGVDYPKPIVIASESREMALAAFASIKKP